jgi:signal transduction histidine kinase/CheY-like chemotaxis protein
VVSGPVEVAFVVGRSPWTTWWALSLYGLAALTLIGGGIAARLRLLERRNRLLETTVRARTGDLVRTIADLEHSEGEARRARDEAEQATRAKSEFLANVSHEIRTPMNAVIGMTSVLLGTPLTREQQDFVGTIRTSGSALLALLNDILDFSKIEAGRLDIESAPFLLRRCVEDAIGLLAREAARKGLAVGCRIAPGVPAAIESDATRLRQILVNLLANAVKFTAAGEIAVTVEAGAWADGVQELRFGVRDTGIGIPADRLNRLFLPFSQADSSTTRLFGGTGLGLAISRRLAEGLGGRLWVDSEPGQGSTFWFTIPCRLVDEATLAALTARPAAGGAADEEEAPPLRILLAEDNVINQRVAQLMLRQLGHLTDTAADGREALDALRRQRYDVVLLDLQMPEMDGLETARHIRAEWPAAERPRLIAMTASTLRADREACLAAGIDDYLTKPVELEALRAVLAGRPALGS